MNTIATDPDNDHVFKVTDFNALNNILQKLEENIIAIEGNSEKKKELMCISAVCMYCMYRNMFFVINELVSSKRFN